MPRAQIHIRLKPSDAPPFDVTRPLICSKEPAHSSEVFPSKDCRSLLPELFKLCAPSSPPVTPSTSCLRHLPGSRYCRVSLQLRACHANDALEPAGFHFLQPSEIIAPAQVHRSRECIILLKYPLRCLKYEQPADIALYSRRQCRLCLPVMASLGHQRLRRDACVEIRLRGRRAIRHFVQVRISRAIDTREDIV